MLRKAFLKLTLAAALLACATASAYAQGVRDALSTFPDSQAVVFFDARRIMADAMPRVVPQAQLDKMFAEVQQKTGVDIRTVHFVGLGVRYKEPFSPNVPPDFVAVLKGDINVPALLSLVRMAGGGATTEETYKGRTITVLKLNNMGGNPAGQKQADGAPPPPKPPGSPFPELFIVSPDANTIIVGVPAFVRSAIDAVDGAGRLRAELLDLVTRNPNNLFSLAADIPASLADTLKGVGMPQNDEMTRIVRSLKQLQLSLSMGETDFGLQSIVRTDNADTARGLNGLVTIGLSFARMGIEEELKKVPADKPDEREAIQTVLGILSNIKNTATDEELLIEASVPQATVATFVRKEMERQEKRRAAQEAAAAQKQAEAEKTPPPAPKRRRATRRRRN